MGLRATFRFYEELNDFLPPARRKRDFSSSCGENATVKQAVEALGVPHTEIEVILVNGESVGFSHRLEERDRVSVYPIFETLDIRPILRLRAEPLRDTRFVADAHLGRLARYLRMFGFDTLYDNALPDRELVMVSCTERRVLLTRDRELLMHRALTHGVFVRGDRPREQLGYVLSRLDLRDSCIPFARCMSCNGPLEPIDRDLVLGRVPLRVTDSHRQFRWCPECGRIYWRGTHYERMMLMVSQILES
jgi:uncharacterized protein with PIN domain/sulfur carrier protein ThiS